MSPTGVSSTLLCLAIYVRLLAKSQWLVVATKRAFMVRSFFVYIVYIYINNSGFFSSVVMSQLQGTKLVTLIIARLRISTAKTNLIKFYIAAKDYTSLNVLPSSSLSLLRIDSLRVNYA